MPEEKPQMTIEEALKEIDRLKAQNAALRSSGKVNRETKNSVFLDMFGRKEYLLQLYRDLHPEDHSVSEDEKIMMTMISPEYIEKAEQKSARIREAIYTMHSLGYSEEDIKKHIMARFSFSEGYAQNWLDAVAEEEESNIFA